jgi:hypothetical protein
MTNDGKLSKTMWILLLVAIVVAAMMLMGGCTMGDICAGGNSWC